MQDAEPLLSILPPVPSHRAFSPFSINSDKEQKIKAKRCSAGLVLRGPEMMGQKDGGVREIPCWQGLVSARCF